MRDAPPCFLPNAVPGRTADGGSAGGENWHDDVLSHCATRAPSANPCGSSAALRRGEAPLGAAPGRPWLRPNLR